MADHPSARGLEDDAALLDGFVITHDTIVEGVHFLPDDPPESVGWKLAAVNLSDLAAKGASPAGALLSLPLGGAAWIEGFLHGLEEALAEFNMPLLGGDTFSIPDGAPRVLGLTALGRAGGATPSRTGGNAGDALFVAGFIGDAAAGLRQLNEDASAIGLLVDAYRRPMPLLSEGRALAPHVTAMMDVSDGLLLDASRLADASSCGATIDLASIPLSDAFIDRYGSDRDARLFAATGGDDYALLFSADPDAILGLSLPSETSLAQVGSLTEGTGLNLTDGGEPISLPETLGYEHRSR